MLVSQWWLSVGDTQLQATVSNIDVTSAVESRPSFTVIDEISNDFKCSSMSINEIFLPLFVKKYLPSLKLNIIYDFLWYIMIYYII